MEVLAWSISLGLAIPGGLYQARMILRERGERKLLDSSHPHCGDRLKAYIELNVRDVGPWQT